MDRNRAPRLCAANRSLLALIPVSILLVISLGWNIWHHRLDHEERTRASEREHAEKAVAALAREEADLAKLKRRKKAAKSDARIQELYKEIDHLTRVSEKVILPHQAARKTDGTTNR